MKETQLHETCGLIKDNQKPLDGMACNHTSLVGLLKGASVALETRENLLQLPAATTVSYSTLLYSMVWYGMVWYGMVWYGIVWYGMVWYGR